MASLRERLPALLLVAFFGITSVHGSQSISSADEEFGPVVRAYLGYLRSEQEVVDDRASRREVSSTYYRRNSNRIKALRQMAIRLARETHNDYLPELEAVSGDEMNLLFGSNRPQLARLRVGGSIEKHLPIPRCRPGRGDFYLFARLDPYEQAELAEKSSAVRRPQQNRAR